MKIKHTLGEIGVQMSWDNIRKWLQQEATQKTTDESEVETLSYFLNECFCNKLPSYRTGAKEKTLVSKSSWMITETLMYFWYYISYHYQLPVCVWLKKVKEGQKAVGKVKRVFFSRKINDNIEKQTHSRKKQLLNLVAISSCSHPSIYQN